MNYIKAEAATNILIASARGCRNVDHLLPAYEFLSSRCVRNKETKSYWVVSENGMLIEEGSEQQALKRVCLLYAGYQANGITLTQDLINSYSMFIQRVDRIRPFVASPRICLWNGLTYLNSCDSSYDENSPDFIAKDYQNLTTMAPTQPLIEWANNIDKWYSWSKTTHLYNCFSRYCGEHYPNHNMPTVKCFSQDLYKLIRNKTINWQVYNYAGARKYMKVPPK